MYNVSFGKAPVFANPNMFIKNAKASEIAEAMNIGMRQAGKTVGKTLKFANGNKIMTGKLLKEVNPDSFSKTTQILTETGKKGFNNITGKILGISVDSKLCDLSAGIRKFAENELHRCDDIVTTAFNIMG